MKTFIIWSDVPESVRFGVIEGDFSVLHTKYINRNETADEGNQLNFLSENATWHPDIQTWVAQLRSVPPLDDVAVIECGFLL